MGGVYSYDKIKALNRKRLSGKQGCRVRITVVLSMCSIAVGANEVLKAVQNTIRREKIHSVIVEIAGCMGLCHAEPIITVYTEGMGEVMYHLVTPEKARVITIAHGLYFKQVSPWVMK
ncbi:MAG: (2Fe-2S) ferredoxin domain-containing protein [Firmicutes bacterium]|nr:(2Fe-2S) ferredoxin domain-containing protein [Bacillota bacterium]